MSAQSTSTIAVAMSGGVDSSVAAALLLERGHAVIGVIMRLPELRDVIPTDNAAPSPAPHYLEDARHVADTLGIPLYIFDMRDEFERQIIRYFCEEYQAGRTPNPCVFCNPQIKFGLLAEHARRLGAEVLATGHYVHREYDAQRQRYLLRAATSTSKDQSYFLYRLTQEQLARARFPLAGMSKEEIRAKARALHLLTIADKAESQENCFISGQRYQEFLRQYLRPEHRHSGPIVDLAGRVLGEHQGIAFYTIGQRRGLGIALGTPRYVVAIQPETNTVVIGENADLSSQRFLVRHINFIAVPCLESPCVGQVKIRYRHAAVPAQIVPGIHDDEVQVLLDEPQRAVTPGQSAVFYQDDLLIGGGIIQADGKA